jgi:hypothetical protein
MERTKIYLITNCYNNPNKVYIGKTKNNRQKDHKRKFGQQIEYSEIDEIYSLDKKDWEPLETYWINQFKAWGFDVLNKNEGGGGPITHSEETKGKISNKLKGISRNYLSLNKERGEKISKSLMGKSKSNKGKPLSEEHKQKIQQTRGFLKNRKNTWQITPVLQYDLQGNFIKEWESQTEATKFLGKTGDGIGACCRGRQKNAYGYIWKFKK